MNEEICIFKTNKMWLYVRIDWSEIIVCWWKNIDTLKEINLPKETMEKILKKYL